MCEDGLAGGMITVYPPEGRAYNSPDYEPLWAAAQDLGMPISLHVGTARPDPRKEIVTIEAASEASTSNSDYLVRMSLGHMIFSGVFERYPKLRVGSVEMELAWIPHFLQAMDFTYSQRAPRPGWRRFKGDARPSDYFHSNIFASFQEDGLGIKLRDIIGVDNLMWGSDYPHIESTFPRSRQILEEILADCTDDEKAKITGGNAAKIYDLN